MDRLFVVYDNVKFTSADSTTIVNLFDDAVSGYDIYNRFVKASVKVSEEYDKKQSNLTKFNHYISFGFRVEIDIAIKIISEEIRSKVVQIMGILSNDKFGAISINPGRAKNVASTTLVSPTYTNMKLVSDISPKEISESVKVGELLTLTFEKRDLLQNIPSVSASTITDVNEDSVIDADGNTIIGF